MSEIPPERIDSMMVKCGRRCCICRRFRPTKLQVHHIVERNAGGTDDEDNLIVICMSCHSDVHTKVPFARRFSVEELKGHREAVVKMVAEGKLPPADTDDTDEVISQVVRDMRAVAKPRIELLSEAVEILTRAVSAEGGGQGLVHYVENDAGFSLLAGLAELFDHTDHRIRAKYKHALNQLLQCRLLEWRYGSLLDVTYEGYLAADEILTSGSDFLKPGDDSGQNVL
jgi:hypothetical protein